MPEEDAVVLQDAVQVCPLLFFLYSFVKCLLPAFFYREKNQI